MQPSSLATLRRSLFSTPLNATISVACLVLLYLVLRPLIEWALVHAVWQGNAQDCRAATGGACWAYIGEKLRFFLFGYFPYGQQWRAALALALVVLVPLLIFWRPTGGRPMSLRTGLVVGALALLAGAWLLTGGLGLDVVDAARTGGLLLSLLLAGVALEVAFPFGIGLALGRTSSLRAVRWPCVAVVELFRSSPMVNVLIIASVVAPLLFPGGDEPSKLARVLVAFIVMAAAYMADALRGGFQAVHPSQLESATAIGMGYWQRTLLVSTPQAVAYSVPALGNIALAFFKETSLVTVVGMVDFLGGVQLAARDMAWLGFELEGYLFAALMYFLICWVLATIARRIELATRFDG